MHCTYRFRIVCLLNLIPIQNRMLLLIRYHCPRLHWTFTRDGLVQCTCTSENFVTHMRSGSFGIGSFVHNILIMDFPKGFQALVAEIYNNRKRMYIRPERTFPLHISLSQPYTRIYDIPNFRSLVSIVCCCFLY